jgi:hypothetical protein
VKRRKVLAPERDPRACLEARLSMSFGGPSGTAIRGHKYRLRRDTVAALSASVVGSVVCAKVDGRRKVAALCRLSCLARRDTAALVWVDSTLGSSPHYILGAYFTIFKPIQDNSKQESVPAGRPAPADTRTSG